MVSFVVKPIRQSVKEGETLKFRIEIRDPDYETIGSYKIFWKAEGTRDNAAMPGGFGSGDYNALYRGGIITSPQEIIFRKGDKYVEVEIQTYRDVFVEGNEYLEINLFDYRGNFLRGSGKVFTIEDRNREPDPPSLRIEALNADRSEGNGDTVFTFRVTRSGDDLSSSTTVNWKVGANASPDARPSDFDHNGRWPEGSVTFGPNDREATIRVTVNGDRQDEPDELFYVELSGASGGATIARAQATGIIRNDDEEAPPPPPAPPAGTIYLPLPFHEVMGINTRPGEQNSGHESGPDAAAYDFHAPPGTNIYAVADGEVVYYNFDTQNQSILAGHPFGNIVTIRHEVGGREFYITYCHLKQENILPGTRVVAGDLIARAGETGIGTDRDGDGVADYARNHLHIQWGPVWDEGETYVQAWPSSIGLVDFTRQVVGNAAANTLVGSEEADALDGRGGADSMEGKSGDDDFQVDNVGDVIVEASDGGFDTIYSDVSYTLSANTDRLILRSAAVQGAGNSGENALYGNALDNRLEGLEGADVLDGLTGTDTMIGGLGDDIYVVDTAMDQTVEAAGEGMDAVFSSLDWTLAQSTEILVLTGTAVGGRGNAEHNRIYGNDSANQLFGYDGDDLLMGGLGADEMTGGLGDDQFVVDDANDVLVEAEDGGRDVVFSYRDYNLGAHLETLVFIGTAGFIGTGNTLDNHLQGGAAADVLIGLDGNDALLGLGGADVMRGGAGDDSYVVDNVGDVTEESADGGVDIVFADLDWTLGANLETLVLLGTSSRTGQGNAANNILFANNAGCTLDGGAGDDTLVGGLSDDIFVGGVGFDIFYGGGGANVARFSGVKSDYGFYEWGGWTVIKGPDGLDFLHQISTAEFADGRVDLGLLATNPETASWVTDITGDARFEGPPVWSQDWLEIAGDLPTLDLIATTPVYRPWDGFDPFADRLDESLDEKTADIMVCPAPSDVEFGGMHSFGNRAWSLQSALWGNDTALTWRDDCCLL